MRQDRRRRRRRRVVALAGGGGLVGGAEEAEIGTEPKLKNAGEAKAVKEIESEEARIDAEEKELAGDPATEDLVDGVI
jgi:hypothetical protein